MSGMHVFREVCGRGALLGAGLGLDELLVRLRGNSFLIVLVMAAGVFFRDWIDTDATCGTASLWRTSNDSPLEKIHERPTEASRARAFVVPGGIRSDLVRGGQERDQKVRRNPAKMCRRGWDSRPTPLAFVRLSPAPDVPEASRHVAEVRCRCPGRPGEGVRLLLIRVHEFHDLSKHHWEVGGATPQPRAFVLCLPAALFPLFRPNSWLTSTTTTILSYL